MEYRWTMQRLCIIVRAPQVLTTHGQYHLGCCYTFGGVKNKDASWHDLFQARN
jgi:hypothetical protein